jgi:hypothetical protein
MTVAVDKYIITVQNFEKTITTKSAALVSVTFLKATGGFRCDVD